MLRPAGLERQALRPEVNARFHDTGNARPGLRPCRPLEIRRGHPDLTHIRKDARP
jgi:hypothetical protein